MFPTIRESAAVVSIILLLMLFLPSRRYTRPIVVALLVVVLMLLAVPLLLQFFSNLGSGLSGSGISILSLAALTGHPSWGAAFVLRPLRCAGPQMVRA